MTGIVSIVLVCDLGKWQNRLHVMADTAYFPLHQLALSLWSTSL